MATVTATTFDLQMADPVNFSGLLNSVANGVGSATFFSTINTMFGGGVWQFTGTGFGGYVAGIPSTGTVTSMTYSGSNGVTITGMSLSIATFFTFVDNGDQNGLYNLVFGGNDTINGSGFSDGLSGYGGSNTINGGDGDDAITTLGIDTIDGGDGRDTIYIDRSQISSPTAIDLTGMATNAGITLANGTAIRNVESFNLTTGNGNDTLTYAGDLAGSNVFNGGAGLDRIVVDLSGSAVAYQSLGDRITNSPFSDVVFLFGVEELEITGGQGGDEFNGSQGNDTLSGGFGDDFLDGQAGNDMLNGGAGNDIVRGSRGQNTLNGGSGDDTISASAFDGSLNSVDIVDGGEGFDLLAAFDRSLATTSMVLSASAMASATGVAFSDGSSIKNVENFSSLSFGSGADTLAIDADIALGFAFWSAGAGADTLIVNLSGVTAALTLSATQLSWAGKTLQFNSVEKFQITAGSGADNLLGGASDDILIGGASGDVLDGGAGSADWADYSASLAGVILNLQTGATSGGDAAGDTLTGIEYLRGSAQADTLTGNTLNNWLFGGAGGDGLNGGDGGDLLQGEDGDDTLNGGDGVDSLAGGNDNDTLIGGAGADSLGGGAGVDTADYAASLAVSVNLQTGAASGGDAAGDTFASVENLIGSAFADVLTGRDGFANTLSGGDGDDVLSGGTGGADVMSGGNGIDTLDYSLSPNGVDVRLFSGAAAGGSANGDTYSSIENIIGAATKTDTLAGDANANSIWGGGGNETITGRENTDTLFGEAGNDTLLGGADSDVLIGGIGADTLGGGSQDDTADYSASDAGVTVNLQTGSGLGGHAQGDALVSIEDVIGSAFNDVIIGKNNVWDNVFDGRGGDDTYTGGLGNDVFVFRLNEGADTITDFVAGGAADIVQLSGFGAGFDSFAEVIAAATQVGADTIIDFGAGQTLTLQNVTLANLNSSDFLFGP